ncbi:MAG: VTT domain-containing protein [Dehalococcoidia bacterium]|nr:VTT domain-containing protein [Dehalococcoidia bacterium]
MGFDIESLINAVGYPGLFLIVFAETGLLIGFFLPGDTLLITTGLLIQRGHLEVAGHSGLWIVIPLLIVAAVVGDAVGYQIGRHAGPRIFNREDSRWFHRKHLERARQFYDRHGGKTIIAARFLAFIRTFAPTVAGAAQMPYHRFAFYNILGAALWVPSMTLMGYFVGKAIPNIEIFFTALVVLMVGFSAAPAIWHVVRERRAAARRRSAA